MPHTLLLFSSCNTDACLFLTEAHRLLHRDSQLMLKCIKVLIGRQIKPVETIERVSHWPVGHLFSRADLDIPCVCLWQVCDLSGFLNRKASRAIAALQVFETVHGDSRCTCGELQQS